MAFARFSKEKLDAWFKANPLSEEAREYVLDSLAVPARNVEGSTKNATGTTTCPKMRCAIDTESATVECKAALNHIFDDATIGYVSQPKALELDYYGKNEKRVRSRYVADFMVLRRNECVIEEWKPPLDLAEFVKKHPGRYEIDQRGLLRSRPAERAAEQLGFKYVIRVGTDISTCRALNQRSLKSYLHEHALAHFAEQMSLLRDFFSRRAFANLAELLAINGVTRDHINFAIATGEVTIDWDHDNIEVLGDFRIFRNQLVLEALTEEVKRPRATTPFVFSNFAPGQTFFLDGCLLRIDWVGKTQFCVIDEKGVPITHPLEWLRTNASHIRLPDASATETRKQNSMEGLRYASSTDIQRAAARVRCATTESEDFADGGYSDRSKRRFKKKVMSAELSGVLLVAALLDRSKDKGFHGPHIDATLSDEIDEFIDTWQADPKRQSVRHAYLTHINEFVTKGKKPISKSSFYARVVKRKTLDALGSAFGHKVKHTNAPTYWQLGLDTPIHQQRPFESVHIDHTLLDVELLSSVTGTSIPRPWLTIAVDANTRRVLGIFLSVFPPSSLSVLMVVLDMMMRHGRRPDSIVVDWGAEFRGNYMHQLRDLLQFDIKQRPKSCPRFGYCIERMFGSVTAQVIHNLIGNTKATKNVRSLTFGTNPRNLAGHTLRSIHELLEDYFFRNYNNRQHTTLLASPVEFEQMAFLRSGDRVHQLIDATQLVPHIFPDAKGAPRVLHSKTGVFVNYEYYGHPKLSGLNTDGIRLRPKFNPLDPSIAYVYFENEWLACKSKRFAELAELELNDRMFALQEYLLAKKAVRHDKDRSDLTLADLINKSNEQALANKVFSDSPEGKAIWAQIRNAPKSLFGHKESPLKAASSPTPQSEVDDLFMKAVKENLKEQTYGEIVR